MSHVSTIATEVNDLAALKEACSAQGWEFREGQTSYRWFGRFVGDTPLPAGARVEDLGRCDHAIRVPGATYEVGIRARSAGGYDLLWDYFAPGGLVGKLGGQGAPVLKRAYAEAKAKRELARRGYRQTRRELCADGTVRLVMVKR